MNKGDKEFKKDEVFKGKVELESFEPGMLDWTEKEYKHRLKMTREGRD